MTRDKTWQYHHFLQAIVAGVARRNGPEMFNIEQILIPKREQQVLHRGVRLKGALEEGPFFHGSASGACCRR
jgi:hypothetical protein